MATPAPDGVNRIADEDDDGKLEGQDPFKGEEIGDVALGPEDEVLVEGLVDGAFVADDARREGVRREGPVGVEFVGDGASSEEVASRSRQGPGESVEVRWEDLVETDRVGELVDQGAEERGPAPRDPREDEGTIRAIEGEKLGIELGGCCDHGGRLAGADCSSHVTLRNTVTSCFFLLGGGCLDLRGGEGRVEVGMFSEDGGFDGVEATEKLLP